MKRWMACQQVFLGRRAGQPAGRGTHTLEMRDTNREGKKREKGRKRWIDREKEKKKKKKWSLHIRNSLRMR